MHGVFRSIGYPSAIARDLTALCSNMTPETFFLRLPEQSRHDWQTRQRFQAPHLPQGAPTSPALANFAAYKLDARISGLAKCFGANYTRYADDLAFSGGDPFARKIKSFLTALNDIIVDEGFTINARKTKIMRHASCQRVTGIVVNEHVNIPRATYDQLKATLHNCINTTPSEQNHSNLPNFRAHIEGRVSWVEHVNPKRGVKLRRMFNQVDW